MLPWSNVLISSNITAVDVIILSVPISSKPGSCTACIARTAAGPIRWTKSEGSMLYIHELGHLNAKSADIESVYLIRELREKTPYPLENNTFAARFENLFVSQTDQEMIQQALYLVEPTLEALQQLIAEANPTYELLNLQRAVQILKEMPEALKTNLSYVNEIRPWQDVFVLEAVTTFNSIPHLRTPEEKTACNQKVNSLFQKVLRHSQFSFNFSDIVHEAQLFQIQGLQESMARGFLFHISLEEELKKVHYEVIKARLPEDTVRKVEHLRGNIEIIKKGVERAYNVNLRMIQWALIMYAYVKWLMNK